MTDVKSLGYIKIQTSDIDRWRTFAFDLLGFAQGSGPDADALYLRMDERPARIIVVPGDTDQVVHVGWEVRDGLALQRVRDTLEQAGVAVKPLSVEEADERQGGGRLRVHRSDRHHRPRCSSVPRSTTVRW